MKELENGRKHTDYVSPIEMEEFLKHLISQLNKTDIVELVTAINSGKEVIENIKIGWKDRKYVIKFSVKSDGTEGPQWIQRLENKDIYVDEAVKELLLNGFIPTSGVLTKVVVIKKNLSGLREMGLFREVARRDLIELSLEETLLIREKFSMSQLSLMNMNALIIKSGNLGFKINAHGKPCLHAPAFEWDDYNGHAFGERVKEE